MPFYIITIQKINKCTIIEMRTQLLIIAPNNYIYLFIYNMIKETIYWLLLVIPDLLKLNIVIIDGA